jgi:hypothetical protein
MSRDQTVGKKAITAEPNRRSDCVKVYRSELAVIKTR